MYEALNRFDQIDELTSISDDLWSEIIELKKFNEYPEYLFHRIKSYILYIAKDASNVPHLSGFYHRKNIAKTENWNFDDADFDHVLAELDLIDMKNELLIDIYEFSFNSFPISMGIPGNYLNKNLIEEIRKNEDPSIRRAEMKTLMKFKQEFESKPFSEESILDEFVTSLLDKFLDK